MVEREGDRNRTDSLIESVEEALRRGDRTPEVVIIDATTQEAFSLLKGLDKAFKKALQEE